MLADYQCCVCGREWQERAGPSQCEQHHDGNCPRDCKAEKRATECPDCNSAYFRWLNYGAPTPAQE